MNHIHSGRLYVLNASTDYNRVFSILAESGLKPVMLDNGKEPVFHDNNAFQFAVGFSWQNEAQLKWLESRLLQENLYSGVTLTYQ